MMVWTEVITTVGVAVGRSITGWLGNALKDGKIDTYEWGQLGSTVVRIAILTLGLSYGLNLETTAAAFSALAGDYVLSALNKKK